MAVWCWYNRRARSHWVDACSDAAPARLPTWADGRPGLDPKELAHIEATAVGIASAAGARALAAFTAIPTLEFKGPKQDDPVTATDRELETFLRTELRSHFPDHGLLGEEHEDDIAPDAAFVWALDPLDGTANFASRLPLWGVSLGLLHHGRPVVACIWVPVGPPLHPGVYHARFGGGAWFEQQRLTVAQGEDDRGRVVALPSRYWRAFRFRRSPRGTPASQRTLADPRSLGSISAEMALVAAGALRLAVFVRPRIWDVAAGALLVQEAGGTALTWRSRSWQHLTCYDPARPEAGPGDPALRHWSQPLMVGSPRAVGRAAARLAWHPRPPRILRHLLRLWS
jgi:myo-inositol-1(or 4)-monophosphatase